MALEQPRREVQQERQEHAVGFGQIERRSRPYLARSSLALTPVLDRLVHSRDVVAQSDPDLFIVDSVVGVRGDDPHALDLPPGNLRRRLDDLVWQLGGNVAQSADDGFARETQRALGIPALLPKPH